MSSAPAQDDDAVDDAERGAASDRGEAPSGGEGSSRDTGSPVGEPSSGADARTSGALSRRPSRDRPDPLLGQTLAGKYEVLALLGEGAMGRVYRARQLALDKEIAVKVLHRHLTGAARIELRFEREARAASRLSHPNSVHIHDFGTTEDGTLYLAMELLDGEDLQTILDHDHPLSPARIGTLLVPVLRALEEAHRAGIIHRDLKPENVVVQPDRSGREHVKVCDFGIAKILDQDEDRSITVDGFVCGTPQYMAPEQGRGDAIDHRCDIYAAGVVLYQMLCGAVPFSGENALGVLTRHVMEAPVPPRERRPELGIPESLEAVCLRAMRKAPSERYQTAAEMAEALERAVLALGPSAESRLGEGPFRGEPAPKVVAPKPTPPTRRGRAWSGVAAAALALAVVGWMATRPSTPTEPPPPEASPRAEVEATPSLEPITAPPEPPPVAALAEPEPAEAALVEPASTEPAPVEPVVEAPTTLEPRPRVRRDRPIASTTAQVAPVTSDAPEASPDAAFDEGRRLFLANDVPGAIARFEDAARVSPRRAEIHKQLGRAYMRAGDVRRSIAAYRRYLELAPDAADRAVVERIIAQHAQ